MSTTWKPAWYGLISTSDGWEVTIRCVDGVHTWEAECFGCSGWGDAGTEDEAKAAALTWIADTLREVPTRAAVALSALTGKAPVTPSQVLAEHIERYEAMHVKVSGVPDSKRKTHDLAYLDGAISSLRMARTIINAPYGPDSASESATLPETPPVATERPVGLVWRETAWGYRAKAEVWTLNLVKASGAWEWHTEFYLPHPWPVCEVGQGTAPTLDAAKAAAEACLRAWVARLNASLGTP